MDYKIVLPGAAFVPCRRGTSITSISNPLQAASSVCASCLRNGPSAEAEASHLAEVDILTDKLAPLYYHCHYILP